MAHLALRILRPYLTRHFFRFCVVGALGFLINAAILLLFVHALGSPFYVAQIVGAETALLVNFMLHDAWTFAADSNKQITKKKRLFIFHGAFAAGMGINSVVTIGAHYLLHFPSILALTMGSAVALFANFLTSRFIVWRSDGASV